MYENLQLAQHHVTSGKSLPFLHIFRLRRGKLSLIVSIYSHYVSFMSPSAQVLILFRILKFFNR